MAGDQRNLSVRLYEILEKIGASEEMRHVHNENVVAEIIQGLSLTLLLNERITIYICGSWCEGTTTPGMGSDVDILDVRNIPVNVDIREAGVGRSFLMVREVNTHPGYFKLQEVWNRVPLTVNQIEVLPNCDTDRQGRICFKHFVIPGLEKHGPANTAKYGSGFEMDSVAAFRCTRIPDPYTEWIHQKRRNDWPPKHLIDRMAKLSCFVVGVGHERSEERDKEWRLSFSLQERELMISLNPVQHKCYVLMKLIKKDVIKPFIGGIDAISSYHCKTCLFYAIENSPPGCWTPENLITCLFRCLDVLLQNVKSGNCPNYFIPGSNMFDRDVFRESRGRVLQILENIKIQGHHILFSLKTDNVGNILNHGTMFNTQKKLDYSYALSLNHLNDLFRFKRLITSRLFSNHTAKQKIQFLVQFLNYLQTIKCIQDHTNHQTREAFSFLIPFVHQILATIIASMAFKANHERTVKQLLSLSNDHFQQGHATDLMNTRLMYVAVLYKLRRYKECEKILERLELKLTRRTISVCCCGEKLIYQKNFDLAKYISDRKLSLRKILLSEIVSCMTFLPSEANILPQPLQYEMRRSENTPPGSRDEDYESWFDWVVVDAKVFLFFMQYLVFTKLGLRPNIKISVENMEWILTCDIHHKDTAYNLMGWVYLQEYRVEEAMRCWRTSREIRPLHNAAKFHESDLKRNYDEALNG